ncbi:hypothetical protein D3C84_856800 [compost metagenome]
MRLLRTLFDPNVTDTMKQQAGSWDGALSMLIGVAANRSIAENRPIVIRELLNPIERA